MKEQPVHPHVEALKKVAEDPDDFTTIEDKIRSEDVREIFKDAEDDLATAFESFRNHRYFNTLKKQVADIVSVIRNELPAYIPPEMENEIQKLHHGLIQVIQEHKDMLSTAEYTKLKHLITHEALHSSSSSAPTGETQKAMKTPQEIDKLNHENNQIKEFNEALNRIHKQIEKIFTEHYQGTAINPDRNLLARMRPIFLNLKHEWEQLSQEAEHSKSHARDHVYPYLINTIEDIANRINHLEARGEIDPQIAKELKKYSEKIFEPYRNGNRPPEAPLDE
jgi:hypothetical protein